MYFPDAVIYGAEQMPYDVHKRLVVGSSIEEQKMYWMLCLVEKQKNIERTKKYASDEDVDWWDVFFNHQHTILDNHFGGYWPLQNHFEWNIGGPSMTSTTHLQPLDNLELNHLIRPHQRDIYVGPRFLHVAEVKWQGNLHELEVGMLVATLAGGDKLGDSF